MLTTLHLPHGPRQIHLAGWKKQSVDPRDAGYSIKMHRAMLGANPTAADNRPICSPIEDQSDLGSCTANALAGLVEANELRKIVLPSTGLQASAQVTLANVTVSPTGVISFTTSVTPPPATPAPVPPAPAPAPKLINASRLFEYYATRKIQGTTSSDSGASIRDTIKAAYTYGVVDEALWPYDISKFAVNPPPNVWTAAATHKVTSYHSITDGDIETMKAVLSAPIPFLIEFGFAVYDYMLSAQMAAQGLLPKPKSTEHLQGGHAVVLVGYDDNKVMPDGSKGAFLVRNSWGTGWGLAGYFWMSYNYVGDAKLSNDFWVVQSAPL